MTEKCTPSHPPQYEWVPQPSNNPRYCDGRRWALIRSGEYVGQVTRPFWHDRWDAHDYGGWYSVGHATMQEAARDLFRYITSNDAELSNIQPATQSEKP